LDRSPNRSARRRILIAVVANEKPRSGARHRHSNMGALCLRIDDREGCVLPGRARLYYTLW
jgi:hypothetical protein